MGMLGLVLAATLAAAPAPAVDEEPRAEAESQAWMQRLESELRGSQSARERALSTLLWSPATRMEPAEYSRRGKLLREAAADAPGDRLVQLLWAKAEDQASGCDSANPCLERERAFARLEPDNSAAWIPVLHKAESDHDERLRDEALAAIGKASHHDGLFAESMDAWLTIFEHHPIPEQVRKLQESRAGGPAEGRPPTSRLATETLLAVSFSGMPVMPPASVFRYCRAGGAEPESAATPPACTHLGQLMVEGPSLIDRGLGLAFLRGTDERKLLETRRQLDWMIWQAMPRPYGNSAMDLGEDEGYSADLRSTGSEIRAIELLLQRRGIPLTPPVGWQKPAFPTPAQAEKR